MINSLNTETVVDDLDVLGQVDLSKEAEEGGNYPPPPPAGDYLMRYDFVAADLDKCFAIGNDPREPEKVRSDVNDGQAYFIVRLIGEIVESLEENDTDPLAYSGRKVFQGLNLNTILRKDGTTTLSNWLKSVVDDPTTIPKSVGEIRQYIVDLIGTGAEGAAHLDWEGRGKSGEKYLPDWEFFRENKKAAKSYPQQMTDFPQNEDGSYSDVVMWLDPRTGEECSIKAAGKIKRFFTKNPKVD
jgi:hypothetical protein